MTLINQVQKIISEQEKIILEEDLQAKFDAETDNQMTIHQDLLEKLKDA